MSLKTPNFKHIIEGFSHLSKGKVFDQTIVQQRVETCLNCHYLRHTTLDLFNTKTKMVEAVKGAVCGSCRCFLRAKILVKNEKCPEKKW